MSTAFDYSNLPELSEAWIGRAYAGLPRDQTPPLLGAMLPALQERAAAAQALTGNGVDDVNEVTTCARLVYDLLEAAGLRLIVDADRDLASAVNLDEELRATRVVHFTR